MNICLRCGAYFEYPVNRYNRRWSESDDSAAYCPYCHSEDFDEADHCIKCDQYFTEDKMIGSICRDCVEKRATKANAYAYAMSIAVDPTEIDGMTESQAREFCLEDIYDFSMFLEGEDD